MKPTFHEKEYLKVIDWLELTISNVESTSYTDLDDYQMGMLEGKKELSIELLMQMQKTVIGWRYEQGEGERNGSI